MITDQGIKFEGSLLKFNGEVMDMLPIKGSVDYLRVSPDDTIKNAVATRFDMFIDMESGDRFILRDYNFPKRWYLHRIESSITEPSDIKYVEDRYLKVFCAASHDELRKQQEEFIRKNNQQIVDYVSTDLTPGLKFYASAITCIAKKR